MSGLSAVTSEVLHDLNIPEVAHALFPHITEPIAGDDAYSIVKGLAMKGRFSGALFHCRPSPPGGA